MATVPFKQEDLHALRQAAEQAWGDDTRHPDFQGHPLPSAGQCYVTSKWLQSRHGGHVAIKNGHYFWVSGDQEHALDLTGDQFAYAPNDPGYEGVAHDEEDHDGWTYDDHQKTWRPGPILFKSSSHPLFKGYRLTTTGDNERTSAFAQRADQALDNPSATISKVALDYMGDAYPAEQPQALEDHSNRYWHDTPDESEQEYKFFYGNGDLHVSPVHSHDDLRSHAGVPKDHTGPMAVGIVTLKGRRASWSINSNVGAQALSRVLKDYTDRVGWKWQGMTDLDGEPIGTGSEFAPKKTMWYAWDGERLKISHHGLRFAAAAAPDFASKGRFALQGKRLFAGKLDDEKLAGALAEFAQDNGLRVVADVPGIGPGGGNFEDRLKNESPMGESLEQYDMGLVKPHKFEPREPEVPGGPFECPQCGETFPDWGLYTIHRKGELQVTEDPEQDSHFPERPEHDKKPLQPHFYEQPDNRQQALANLVIHEPSEYTEPYLRTSGFIQTAANTWKLSLTGQPPHSMIDDPIPVIFDIRKDELHHGQPGQKLSDIPGQFTPGGIVEGEYSPGGKLVLRSVTSDPFSVYHLGELWYWTFPHMELTGIEMQDDAGNTTKLATENVMYHIAPQMARQQILSQGLRPGQNEQRVWQDTEYPMGVYLHPDFDAQLDEVEAEGNVDLWEVDVLGLTLLDDPLEQGSYYTPESIPPTRVRLAIGGHEARTSAQNVGQYIRQLALIDPAATAAWHALRDAGGKVYVVGGAVRDALLQKEPKDIDLMVSGVPSEAVRRALEALPGEVNLTGKDFGVYRYRTKGHEVEIALPRTEQSTGEKRTDFDVQVDHNLPVEADLQRRDFTVNSMAVDLDSGQLIDPYGGADDIQQRRLQTTHPNSFEEDATRLVRALVASSRHGVVPTERTRREIEQNAYRLDGEARERIQAELDKLFSSDNPAGALRLAQETGLLKHLYPDHHENFDYDQHNPHHNYTLGQHSLNVLEGVQERTKDPDLRLAAWYHDIGKPASAWTECKSCGQKYEGVVTGACTTCGETGHMVAHYYQAVDQGGPKDRVIGADHAAMGATMAERWMRDMKYPVSRIKRTAELVQHHMYPDFSSERGARKFLNRVGDHADDLMTLREADREGKGTDEYQATKTAVDTQRALVEQVRAQGAATNVSALAVNGNDLIQAGIPQGPQIGQVLQQLTNAVLEDPSLNNRDSLLQLAAQYASQS